jgi:threonine/homoserine efflux transporter RhtA
MSMALSATRRIKNAAVIGIAAIGIVTVTATGTATATIAVAGTRVAVEAGHLIRDGVQDHALLMRGTETHAAGDLQARLTLPLRSPPPRRRHRSCHREPGSLGLIRLLLDSRA